MSYERQQLSLESEKRGLKTRIDFNMSLPNYRKGISPISTPTGVEFINNRSLVTSGSIFVRQPVLMTNGEFYIHGYYYAINQDNENYNKQGQLITNQTRIFRDDLTINYTQKILQPNERKITLRQNERRFTLAERSFLTTQSRIYYDVMSDFYNLFKQQRRLEIERSNVEQQERNYTNTVNKYRAGIVAEVAALQAEGEFDQAKDRLKQEEMTYKRQLDQYKRYIGIPLDEEIEVEGEISVNIIEIDPEKALEEAMKNSAQLLQGEYTILDQKDNVETVKARRKLTAELTLSYGLNESEDYSEDQWEKNLFKDYSQTNTAVLSVNVPVFDWGRQKLNVERAMVDIKSSELNLENQKRLLRIDIQNVLDRIISAQDRMNILARSEKNAEKSYLITEERYNIGEISIEDLFRDLDRLKNARISTLQAQIDYLLAIAELNYKTLWDFEGNHPMSETIAQIISR